MFKMNLAVLGLLIFSQSLFAAEITSVKVKTELSKAIKDENIWSGVKEETVMLVAQPIIAPRPKKTETQSVKVQSVNDGKWIAFRMTWKDDEYSEAGKLGTFSDAVALEFPVKDGPLTSVFMGAKDNPVHLYHWRAMYQHDRDTGRVKEPKDMYPNMNPDMYHMDYKDEGNLKGKISEDDKAAYNPGKAAGNPQSYVKLNGVDEIFAEGFGTSSIQDVKEAEANGVFKNKQWSVVILRPMKSSLGSVLATGKDAHIGFAVWQGGKNEVGARKSLTMAWIPLNIK